MSGNIPIRNLTAANWVLTGTAVLLSAGRFGIRYKTQRGFHADDYTHLLALLGLLAFSITYQLGFPTFIDVVEISDGTVPEPADFDAVVKRYRQYQTAVSITEWVTLWAVKFTFLLFYRLLFSVSKGFRTAWWLIFVFTALAFWVPITGVLTLCGPIGNFFNAGKFHLVD
ncbi:hypothetical protein MMC25_001451 [Agyrium rufum]|nr:hypothetical protein [Agyrium rufum]